MGVRVAAEVGARAATRDLEAEAAVELVEALEVAAVLVGKQESPRFVCTPC